MPTGWICGQTARDFIATKTGFNGSMDIQKSAEFQTSKFFAKTDFDMKAIAAEEADYAHYEIPKAYTFKSREERERVLYNLFMQVNMDIKELVATMTNKNGKNKPAIKK